MRRRLLLTTALAGTVAVLAVPLASGHARVTTTKFKAALNVGQVTPHPKGTMAGASGLWRGTLTGTTLKWTLTFTHLSGPATMAHIHNGARGVNGKILIPLCAPCHSPESGTKTITAAEIADLKSGKTYANVHTARNPNGEIRGQITIAH